MPRGIFSQKRPPCLGANTFVFQLGLVPEPRTFPEIAKERSPPFNSAIKATHSSLAKFKDSFNSFNTHTWEDYWFSSENSAANFLANSIQFAN